jgi:hypothetical protein
MMTETQIQRLKKIRCQIKELTHEALYKVVNGTSYSIDTPDEIIYILENAKENNIRIRVFYGDVETGQFDGDNHYNDGYVSRSTGKVKVPLISYHSRSLNAPLLCDDCIVKIVRTKDKGLLYQHPNYHTTFPCKIIKNLYKI